MIEQPEEPEGHKFRVHPPTDERMVPESSHGSTFWEHVARYEFAAARSNGKDVLDIACGEGYGAAAMVDSGARSVVGVDVDPAACDHARSRYGIRAIVGSAESIPLPDSTIDLIVSYETIEHVSDPERFIRECRRVLKPDGELIISTPNMDVYDEIAEHNPFHISCLSTSNFRKLLLDGFGTVTMYSQRPLRAPWWSVRAFAADQSLWTRRGFRKIKRMIARRLPSYRHPEVSAEQRRHVLANIKNSCRRRTSALSLFDIVPQRKFAPDEPLFLLALAGKPIK